MRGSARILTLVAVTAALTACQETPDTAVEEPAVIDAEQTNDRDIATEQADSIPETVEDPDWTMRYSPDVPYYNVSDEAVPAFAGADPRTAFKGQVGPGDGGFIETCAVDSTYCKIAFGGEGATGWVDMTNFSGVAN